MKNGGDYPQDTVSSVVREQETGRLRTATRLLQLRPPVTVWYESGGRSRILLKVTITDDYVNIITNYFITRPRLAWRKRHIATAGPHGISRDRTE